MRKDWAAADDLFRQALALDPDDPDALHLYSLTSMGSGRIKDAFSIREKLRSLEPFVPVYNLTTAWVMQLRGQGASSIPILEAIPLEGAIGAQRNEYLARAYAAEGRYRDAADTLLAIPQNQNMISRPSVEDAARLLRSAPAKTSAPESLPALENELSFVYAYVGAMDRVLDSSERSLQIGYVNAAQNRSLWYPLYAPVRKTERFKAFVRNAGLVDYWRARGWPDLCRPMGSDDFVCD
jgi:tetratricopeptide (TPR) repeat protein